MRLKQRSKLQQTKCFKSKVLSRVFSEDYDSSKNKILDPKGHIINKWNKTLIVACLVSLLIDPLFFFLPITSGNICIDLSVPFQITLTVVRSVFDVFYVFQIFVKFHTAYVAPSSRVIGRGELVIDSSKIASRYIRSGGFFVDLFAALPLPQIFVWFVVPKSVGWDVMHINDAVWLLIMIQFVPRACLVYVLWSQIVDTAGIITKNPWTGAAFNLLLYMIAAHVIGGCYYLFALERLEDCWHTACSLEKPDCPNSFFDCRSVNHPDRANWFQSTNVTSQCTGAVNGFYQFGIYGPAVPFNFAGIAFMNKYFYCFWWGLKNLSTIGQNLLTSVYVGENIFAAFVGIIGLCLLALLIGNMQRSLFSTTRRLEEWKIKRADTEQWMHQRQLPPQLRLSVRKHDRYKWIATKGVDEEALIASLPIDLRRKVKRHLCLDLIRQVPLFLEMDETMLDAICERLKPALCTKDVCLVREGDPVNQMLFIMRGNLESYMNEGSINPCRIGPGDFCGDELVAWALDPRPSAALPLSTCTLKAVSEVEAFALMANDLKFAAAQFRRLHSKQLRHKFRFYSHHWRTWAARTIQVSWRRYKRLKELGRSAEPGLPPPGSFWSIFAEKLVASTRWSKRFKLTGSDSGSETITIEKPHDPYM